MRKMYVGNIAFNTTEQDLRDLFSEYGEIESLKIRMKALRFKKST